MIYSPQLTWKFGHHYGQGLHRGYIWPRGVEGVNWKLEETTLYFRIF